MSPATPMLTVPVPSKPSFRVIGLAGKKQTGKDTTFSYIKELLPSLRVERFAFADALKAEVAAVCGVPIKDVDDRKALYRLMLQWWGTEWRRGQDRQYWVNQLKARLEVARDASFCDIAVVTDVRFTNEADLIRDFGGQVWRLLGQISTDIHASELEMDSIIPDHLLHSRPGELTHLKERTAELLWRVGLPCKFTPAQAILLPAPATPAQEVAHA